MALGRIKPYLIDIAGAYANQVLTYNVASSSVSWENPTGGDSFATTNASTITIQAGNVIPTGNAVYSLGGPEAYWKDLYVSAGTIVLGNASISVDESANVVFTNRVTSQPAKIAVDEIVIGRGANKKSIKLDENDATKIRFGSAKLNTAKDEDFSAELGNVSSNVDLVQSNVSSLPNSAANDHATYTSLSTLVNTVQSNLTSVIGASPSALDTLAEIAAALENDANVAVTLTNKIDTVSSNAKFNSSDFWGFYSNETELTANYIHGAFAHVHATGAAYYGHGGSWVRLANHSDLYSDTDVTAHVDSAYVQARQTAQDFAFSSLTGTPTTLAGYGITDGGGGGGGSSSGSIVVEDTFTIDGSTNAFTVSTEVASANNLLVAINGLVQHPDAYTVSGTTLTLANTSALPSGKLGVRNIGAGGSAAAETWVEANSNTTMEKNSAYFVDCSSGTITMTLPASASLGDGVRVIDATGSSETNTITIARNSHKIAGVSEDMTVSQNRAAFKLVYYNSGQGWVLAEV